MMARDMLLVALVCLLIGTFAVSWAYHKVQKDIDECKVLSDSLEGVNRLHELEIDSLNLEIGIVQKRLDSLKKQRNKIIVEYVSKYEEIDSASADALLDEFKSILPKTVD